MLMYILIGLSFLFVFSELILTVTKRSKQKSVKMKKDRGSLIIIWVIISISITAGFNLAHFGKWYTMNFIIYSCGLATFALGMFFRWTTIIQLKKAFTVDVAINKEHDLKTDGLFRIVRHPSYLGIMLIISGISIGMNSLLSFLVITIPVFASILYRIHVEEVLLLEEFKTQYEDYRKRTKKIIPFIY
jgi:protein-S-isoprenylcysteine O-methyltransferase Ste14